MAAGASSTTRSRWLSRDTSGTSTQEAERKVRRFLKHGGETLDVSGTDADQAGKTITFVYNTAASLPARVAPNPLPRNTNRRMGHRTSRVMDRGIVQTCA